MEILHWSSTLSVASQHRIFQSNREELHTRASACLVWCHRGHDWGRRRPRWRPSWGPSWGLSWSPTRSQTRGLGSSYPINRLAVTASCICSTSIAKVSIFACSSYICSMAGQQTLASDAAHAGVADLAKATNTKEH